MSLHKFQFRSAEEGRPDATALSAVKVAIARQLRLTFTFLFGNAADPDGPFDRLRLDDEGNLLASDSRDGFFIDDHHSATLTRGKLADLLKDICPDSQIVLVPVE